MRRALVVARDRGLSLVVLAGVFAGAGWYFAQSLHTAVTPRSGDDFAITYTAGLAMRHGVSLYDSDALRAALTAHVGSFTSLFRSPFTNYNHLPPDALFNVPFTYASFSDALTAFRRLNGILYAASVIITGLALPRESRRFGWVVGILALLLFWSVAYSIGLGQNDSWVMLALAVSLWACARKHWWLVGVGLGVATTLKVIPIIIVVYLLFRGRRQAVLGATATAVALLGAATLAGNHADLANFFHRVAPTLSRSTIHLENQSIPAFLARSFSSQPIFDTSIGIGAVYRFGALSLAGTILFLLAWIRRHQPVEPLEIGVVLLVGLCFAPVVWDHYASWTIPVLMLFADRRLWRDVRGVVGPWRGVVGAAVVAGVGLMILPMQYFESNPIASFSVPQITTGPMTVALALWLSAGAFLLLRPMLSSTSDEPKLGGSNTPEKNPPKPAIANTEQPTTQQQARPKEGSLTRGVLTLSAVVTLFIVAVAGFTIGDFKRPKSPALVGHVKASEQHSLTITRPNGQDLQIYASAATVVEKTIAASPAGITPGSTVLVHGKRTNNRVNANEVVGLPSRTDFATTPVVATIDAGDYANNVVSGEVGKVKTIWPQRLTITKPNGQDLQIYASKATTFEQTIAGTPADITPGSTVLVQGKHTYLWIDANRGELVVLPADSRFGDNIR